MNEITALTESTYYILLALHTPRHGYGIMQEVEHLSAGRVRLAAGTLYGALTSLCDKGWIVPLPSVEDSRRKEYRLTEIGLSVLQNELSRLRQLVENGISILGEE
ncbi:MAG: helix-turn-helix transcriptional regulator [Clostridia bacterium]|nr:helix-turn-helix transcriptional regulator [Oscillospiraceae bacterium]MBQ2750238.1 helix-turn-helix transcriptional regulator [Clostridia bacterium]MBQ4624238.1 helix-turn-helix transcriptional regulator [Clostridia bacterium]MBQ6990386.1 helix-turn-helix transcriptional regulator [Clostridia bacterium]MBQ7119035.1 helix-turn-helix transcriptional regulator [Oscillospiraceae bacterium]